MGDLPAQRSDGRIACQPGNTVEVRIVTGEVGETTGLHDRDDQGITHEQLMPLAHEGCSLDQGRSDRNGLDSEDRNLRDGVNMKGQLGDLNVMFSQSSGDPGRRPAEPIERLEGHQAMGNLAQDVRRDEAG